MRDVENLWKAGLALLVLAICLAGGGLSGYVCHRFGLEPLVVTLGMSSVVVGALLGTNSKLVNGAGPGWLQSFTAQASKTDLDAWVNKYMLPVTTVKDPDGTGTVTLNTLGGREQAYIVDLTTMKILQIITGDITGIGATSGGKAMTAMHQLLGK